MRQLITIFALFATVAIYAQPETINVGSAANDGTGDPLRTAMQKVNTNDAAAFDSIDNIRTDLAVAQAAVYDTVQIADTVCVTFCIPDSSMLREDTWIAWSQNNYEDTMHVTKVVISTPHSGAWNFDYNVYTASSLNYAGSPTQFFTTDNEASGSDLYGVGQIDEDPNNPYIPPGNYFMIEITDITTKPPYGAAFTLHYYVY